MAWCLSGNKALPESMLNPDLCHHMVSLHHNEMYHSVHYTQWLHVILTYWPCDSYPEAAMWHSDPVVIMETMISNKNNIWSSAHYILTSHFMWTYWMIKPHHTILAHHILQWSCSGNQGIKIRSASFIKADLQRMDHNASAAIVETTILLSYHTFKSHTENWELSWCHGALQVVIMTTSSAISDN